MKSICGMKKMITGIALLLPALIACVNAPKKAPTGKHPGFAVVELFTSGGCSSCPPADELVKQLRQEYSDKPLYILAFHVDYWDRLGWKDRFSAQEYTARQRRYADWLHLETVYTPQIVVNGAAEFVGSNANAVTTAITNAFNGQTEDSLSLKGKIEGDQLHITYQVSDQKDRELVLALVQKNAETNVRAGENTGKHLTHVQIVRKLVQANLKKNALTIRIPGDLKTKDWQLIGLLQRTKDGQITAASQLII